MPFPSIYRPVNTYLIQNTEHMLCVSHGTKRVGNDDTEKRSSACLVGMYTIQTLEA